MDHAHGSSRNRRTILRPQYGTKIATYSKGLLVTRVLMATVQYDRNTLSPETPSAFKASSRIRSGAKDGLDLVSSQFREPDELEDSLFPILIPGRPKREGFDPIPLGSL